MTSADRNTMLGNLHEGGRLLEVAMPRESYAFSEGMERGEKGSHVEKG